VTDVETRIRAVLAAFVDGWMTTPCSGLGDQVPGEMIDSGQGKQVLEYVEDLADWGVW